MRLNVLWAILWTTQQKSLDRRFSGSFPDGKQRGGAPTPYRQPFEVSMLLKGPNRKHAK